MKLLNKIVVFFIIFSSFLIAQSDSLNINECSAEISIKTDINNSIIFLNDKKAGEGNIRLNLSEGKYFIKISEGENLWGSKYFSDTLIVNDCSEQKLYFNFNSDVYLNTSPHNVTVFNNDSLVGYTPLSVPGFLNSVELKKEGYESRIINLNRLNSGEMIKLNYTGNTERESFIKKDLFKILAGSLILLGGTTAYFKLKADDNFAEYQFTGDKNLLDKTRRNDLISGITFAALQINFGALIYFFLIE